MSRHADPTAMCHDTMRVNGLHLHYYRTADCGPKVIFIHGLASSGRMWRSSLERLENRITGLALDLPGHGASDKPAYGWYSMANFLSALRGFAEATHAQKASFVGHSMGGSLALEYARRYPQSTERLVLVNPVVSGRLYVDLPWLSRHLSARWMLDLGRRLWPHASAHLRARIERQHSRGHRGGYLQRNQEDLALTTADSLLGSAGAIARADLSGCLDSITAPSLVIVGRWDATVPPREGRLASRRLPRARLAELPAGHLPFDEAPERFLDLLEAFLLETPRPDPHGDGQEREAAA
jgi:pimeloyl-ACP methyl ester carboxylesterase